MGDWRKYLKRVTLQDHLRFVSQMPLHVVCAQVRLEQLLELLNAGIQVAMYDCFASHEVAEILSFQHQLGDGYTLHFVNVSTANSLIKCAVFRKTIWHPQQNTKHLAFIDEQAVARRIKDVVDYI